jgi:hypothetical protein
MDVPGPQVRGFHLPDGRMVYEEDSILAPGIGTMVGGLWPFPLARRRGHTAASPRCLGDILLAICERGEDVTTVLRTASDE